MAADAPIGAPAEPLYARVARRAQSWGPGGTVGLVVGATAPVELERIRGIAPGLALLVPGVGAQGGEVEPVLRFGPAVAAPAGGRPAAGCWSTSLGASRARRAGRVARPATASRPAIAGDPRQGAAGVAPADVAELLAFAAREWSERLPASPAERRRPMTQVDAADPTRREAWEVASTGRRAAAWFIDLVLLSVLVSVVALVLGGWHATTRTMINDDGSTWTASTYYLDGAWSYSLLALFSAIYAIPMWRASGATVGQRLLGLRVVDVSGPEPLSWFGPRSGGSPFSVGRSSAWRPTSPTC